MDKITLGQIWTAIVWVAGAIGVLGVIVGFIAKVYKIAKRKQADDINKAVESAVKSVVTPMVSEIGDMKTAIVESRLSSCKNFLVRFLSDVEQNQPIDEIEKERFCEVYDEYKSLGGNSYIHDKVEKLKEEGRL